MSHILKKQMEFREFINAFYVKGLFNNKPDALLKFLKGSVAYPEKLSFSVDALNSYIRGDPIYTLASDLINAGLSTERISAYIQSLYETKHKETPTYTKRFGNKKFKDVLYSQVKDKFDGITLENMDEVLAKEFFALIQTAKEESDIKALRRQTTDIVRIISFIQKIDQTVCEMITIGRSIAESRVTTRNDHVSISNLNKSLCQKLSHLSELSSALYACNEPVLEKAINQVYVAIQSIETSDFILTESEFMLSSNRNYLLHKLLDRLDNLQTEADKISKT